MDPTTKAISVAPISRKQFNVLIAALIGVSFCACFTSGGLVWEWSKGAPEPIPTVTPTPTAGATATATPTPTPKVTGTLTGKLDYPGDKNPPMQVCATSLGTSEETCVKTEENAQTYELKVAPGMYYVFAFNDNDTLDVAYFTKCDLNTQQKCSEKRWYEPGYICYDNAECKLAFMPYSVYVAANVTTDKVDLRQGWSLPGKDGNSGDAWQEYFH